MWEQIGRLHAHHGEVPTEVRLLKLTEEVGEAAEARSHLERRLATVTERAGLR